MGDVRRWDERYARGDHARDQPTDLLVEVAGRLEPGRALDLACGAGRHTLYLAARGWNVDAVDGSTVAIERVQARAVELGLSQRVTTTVADLETAPRAYAPMARSFDLVCVFYYLNRAMFEELRHAVRPGGLFVAAIHVGGEVAAELPPKLLLPGELHGRFADWELLLDREKDVDADPGDRHRHGTAQIVARRPFD